MGNDLRLESCSLDRILPYAENARTHSDDQVAQIAASIKQFGFVNPVLVDAEGVLIAGHGRVMAAKRLGLASVPALRLGHLSPARARALRLADNQIALNSGWDEALLASEIARIRDEAVVDLDLLGFSAESLEQLLAQVNQGAETGVLMGDEDALAPEPPARPACKPGDLWRLGRHRLLCGDATDPSTVARLTRPTATWT
jgi:ParB-like chromosome segregation protein Spo0J